MGLGVLAVDDMVVGCLGAERRVERFFALHTIALRTEDVWLRCNQFIETAEFLIRGSPSHSYNADRAGHGWMSGWFLRIVYGRLRKQRQKHGLCNWASAQECIHCEQWEELRRPVTWELTVLDKYMTCAFCVLDGSPVKGHTSGVLRRGLSVCGVCGFIVCSGSFVYVTSPVLPAFSG
jgi:hypothetical protein